MRAWAAPILSLALAACGGPAVAPTDAGITDTAPIDEPLPATDGGAGYALSFDGVDDYATAGNGGFTTAEGTTTIELWVRFESGATDQDFIVLRLNLESGLRIGIHAGTIAARRIFGDRGHGRVGRRAALTVGDPLAEIPTFVARLPQNVAAELDAPAAAARERDRDHHDPNAQPWHAT